MPDARQDIAAKVSESEVVLTFADRRYRVRGLARNLAYDVLKVNLLASAGETLPRRYPGSLQRPGQGQLHHPGRPRARSGRGGGEGRSRAAAPEAGSSCRTRRSRTRLAPKPPCTANERDWRDRPPWPCCAHPTSRARILADLTPAASSARPPTPWSAIWRRYHASSTRPWRC